MVDCGVSHQRDDKHRRNGRSQTGRQGTKRQVRSHRRNAIHAATFGDRAMRIVVRRVVGAIGRSDVVGRRVQAVSVQAVRVQTCRMVRMMRIRAAVMHMMRCMDVDILGKGRTGMGLAVLVLNGVVTAQRKSADRPKRIRGHQEDGQKAPPALCHKSAHRE